MPGKVLQEVLKLLPSGSNEINFIRAWNMSELERPAVLCKEGSGCGGCKVAGGLYLRCGKPLAGSWCKTCEANMVSDGRPKHGIFAERIVDENWRTDEGKCPITFMQYLKKKGMTRADGEEFLGGSELPEYEWKLPTRGRRGSAASDTSSEGGRGKYTSRYLPIESYKGVSPSDVEYAHKGSNGKVLRVYKYGNGTVRKVNPNNWTDVAHTKFEEMYGGDGSYEGFEETKKKRGKKHQNDAAIEQMDEMRAMLEKLTAERDAAQAALQAKDGVDDEKVDDEKVDDEKVDDEKVDEKAVKKAQIKADKVKKRAEKLAKKKAEAAEAIKKQQEELKRQQEELQKQMADEMDEEDDSDAFDSDEEEVVFNGYEHNGTLYHLEEESQELSTEDGEHFGYIDSDGEVHEGEKPEE